MLQDYQLMRQMLSDKSMNECDTLVRYLVRLPATRNARAAYDRAAQIASVNFTGKQKLLWEACLRNNRLLPFVDAYLAFSQPGHPIRKKIFIMLAVLETQPEYSRFFLPSTASFFKPVLIVIKLTFAVIKIPIGRVLTWFI